MKRLMRSNAVQTILGWMLGVYLQVILHTVRWRHENLDCVEPVLASDSGAIALFWHGRIPLGLAPTHHQHAYDFIPHAPYIQIYPKFQINPFWP